MLNNAWEEMVIDAKVRMLDSVDELYNSDGIIDDVDIYDRIFQYGFNTDYEYCYYNEAKDICNQLDTWNCISLVRNYEKYELDEPYTDVTDPCKVANMIWYVVGYCTYNELINKDEFTYNELKDAIKAIDVERVLHDIEWYIDRY